jgi:hypothetical protein
VKIAEDLTEDEFKAAYLSAACTGILASRGRRLGSKLIEATGEDGSRSSVSARARQGALRQDARHGRR